MKKILILFVIFNAVFTTIMAQSYLSSFNLQSGKRTVRFVHTQTNFLQFEVEKIKIGQAIKRRSIKGGIVSLNDSNLILVPQVEYMLFSYSSDSSMAQTQKYKNANFTVSLNLNEISKISYQSKNSENWAAIGTITMVVGVITTSILAPLISYKSKTGTFNTNSFLTCAGIGIGIFAIGFPIALLNGHKDYYLIQPEDHREKRLWKFE